MLNKIRLLFSTVVHLKKKQLYFQLFYKLRNRIKGAHVFGTLDGYRKENVKALTLVDFRFLPNSSSISSGENAFEFSFLNLQQSFQKTAVDWNFAEHGKLWCYNLNYFDFLWSAELEKKEKRGLIRHHVDSFPHLVDGLEPFPISLRGINWIKYFSLEKIHEESLNQSLYRQYKVLLSNLEFHILANHLLENAFSLLYGAYYFRSELFYRKAKELLQAELTEQVLQDGAHFERSPMYHQILLFRLLDCINLVSNNDWKEKELLDFMISKARLMLGWLKNMTFSDGSIPMFQDAAFGIAPSSSQLKSYAEKLGIIEIETSWLSDSGYRKLEDKGLEMIMNVGAIGPTYQPGHAHADELNFALHCDGSPVIVDMGISTYEKNQRRQVERSTSSHNCVVIEDANSSMVWGGFRVAKRAQVERTEDSPFHVVAQHNGYKRRFGCLVERGFKKTEEGIEIIDRLKGKPNNATTRKAYLYLHPSIKSEIRENLVDLGNVILRIEGANTIYSESYELPNGYNRFRLAERMCIHFNTELKTLICAKNSQGEQPVAGRIESI